MAVSTRAEGDRRARCGSSSHVLLVPAPLVSSSQDMLSLVLLSLWFYSLSLVLVSPASLSLNSRVSLSVGEHLVRSPRFWSLWSRSDPGVSL